MNYNDFFNKLLLEAINNPLGAGSRYEIPDGIGAEGLADAETDPEQLEKDLDVNGQPKGTPESARLLFDRETAIDTSTPEAKRESIKKAEEFLRVLRGYLDVKDLKVDDEYTDLGILANLIRKDPKTKGKYDSLLSKIERFKEADELIKRAKEIEREAEGEEEAASDGPPTLPM